MSQSLPYLLIDDEFALNYSLVALILYRLGLSPRKNAALDFEKLQILLYLTKNPSKINAMLNLAGKKVAPINSQYTYTIESLSTNVDMLFDRAKLKYLLRHLAARGMLACDKTSDPRSLKYLLSPSGAQFVESLIAIPDDDAERSESSLIGSSLTKSYFMAALEAIDNLSSLQSVSLGKLNSYLNTIFKGN
ncbi:ABC-three component system middle component 4 [Pseudomonas aeruginosa]|uniref:ABC-three component system middle component 4 n=1 Tax=Pseudomonas aeruginosa TaxID=287 RepID=UPI000A739134|nr:ABC-three component system middle component 4 [Pseudomonas aeruginosa]MDT8259347.1 hypothetical protein [Pseudomonas aeruginosa]